MRSSERGTGKEESRKPLRINGYKDFRFLIFVLRASFKDGDRRRGPGSYLAGKPLIFVIKLLLLPDG